VSGKPLGAVPGKPLAMSPLGAVPGKPLAMSPLGAVPGKPLAMSPLGGLLLALSLSKGARGGTPPGGAIKSLF